MLFYFPTVSVILCRLINSLFLLRLQILGDMSPTPKLPSALRREAENALFAEDRQSSRSDRSNGFIFRGFNFHFCGPLNSLRREFAIIISRFANAQIIADVNGPDITHFIIDNSRGPVDISHIRAASAARSRFKIPHIVSMEWIEECWKEQTLLDEESMFFLPPPPWLP